RVHIGVTMLDNIGTRLIYCQLQVITGIVVYLQLSTVLLNKFAKFGQHTQLCSSCHPPSSIHTLSLNKLRLGTYRRPHVARLVSPFLTRPNWPQSLPECHHG